MTAPAPARRRGHLLGVVALLGAAMATATYLQGALSVVSSFIIEEFAVSRSQLGAAFTAFSLTGAAASPVMGAFTDRGADRVMAALFGLSGAAVLVVALAPGYGIVIAGCVVGGLALGAGNPVTNRVIAERISRRRRGLVVGLKQAGPPLGLLVAGVLLPPLALAVGWRWALAVSLVIPLAGLVATPLLLAGRRASAPVASTRMSGEGRETRAVVGWLTVIGLGVALSLSALIAFIPLYAQERVGATAAVAGALAAVMGLAGVVGRIGWGAVAGRFSRPSSALLIISAISVLATVAVAGA
ncbi:MAG: MFS transporter, partial [Actinomycetota bacterium]